MTRRLFRPVLDRSGRAPALKIVVLILLLVPAAWLATRWIAADLGPRAFTELNHQTGLWTIRFAFLALAVTPFRIIARWPKLIQVRRMIGVAAALYAIAHLLAYAADQAFDLDKVASEITGRVYLIIGFAALIGLVLLLITSTDGMMRRLGGRRWRLLHRLAYVIGALGVVHFVMQSKLDVGQATYMAGFFFWLMGFRLLDARFGERGRVPLWNILALVPLSGLLTMAGEALYFWLHNGVDPGRILLANLSLEAGVRPGWIVIAAAGTVALMGFFRRERSLPTERRVLARGVAAE
ncbi:MAG: sulfoxide reductase heme-binding subunit YedZ [Alphaproteobacteria bacterium]|nr:sulfoxide reductase heme-binding subunit YedZ [Alphaproteobacteria bacterium]